MDLAIIPKDMLERYKALHSEEDLYKAFNLLEDAPLSTDDFSFYVSVAAVYSSKIEGEQIELDSYVKHKRFHIEFQQDYIRKTDDLYLAYQFASKTKLNYATVKDTYTLLAKHLVPSTSIDKFRSQDMSISTITGQIVYIAPSPTEVPREMTKLYADLAMLQISELSLLETFFFASMIHLVFVKIHPWSDGNGRSARLLEKWFLAEKLGNKAWLIQSEKYYYTKRKAYYDNLRHLGSEYPTLDYDKALSFLSMLPNSILEKI